MSDFIRNVLAYPSAFFYVFRHGLAKYFILSGILSLLIGGATIGSAYFFSDDIAAMLLDLYPWEVGKGVLESVGTYVIGGALVGFGLIAYKYLILIVIGPFMGPLSERVEEIETGVKAEGQGLGQIGYAMVRGVRMALRNITKELFYTILLLIAGLFPFFSPVAGIMIFVVQAFYMGFANTDYHMEKRYTVREAVSLAKENRMALIGNGTGFLLILLIPVVGLLIAPVLGTVVATKDALRKGY